MRWWTEEEKEYLINSWGYVSIPGIAKRLGRSVNAVKIKAQKLHLGAWLESGDYITLNQLMTALKGNNVHTYDLTSYVANRGLPVKVKSLGTKKVKVIYLEAFWKWAEKNKSFLDFSKFEENMFGEEPRWAKDKRRQDVQKTLRYKTSPWTKAEDSTLICYLKQHRYGYDELSKILHRTNGAIQRRICGLGIKERPVKANTNRPWSDEEKQILERLILSGAPYSLMPDEINRSEKAIRGYVWNKYGTENLDKVRAYEKTILPHV